MLAEKVPLEKAQKVKTELILKNILDKNYKPKKTKSHIFFPIKEQYENSVEIDLERIEKTSLHDRLSEMLTESELNLLKLGRDIIGTIAVLEIDPTLRQKEIEIAKAILQSQSSIKTVVRKDTKHQGKYRLQLYKYLAGEKTTTTTHVENGIKITLDLNKAYYSPRMATERKRIKDLVQPNENILVLGGGVGPYALTIAKKTSAKTITSIEHNAKAVEYEKQNARLNKIKNLTSKCADANKYLIETNKIFDRIVIPAPDNSEIFLKNAEKKITKKGFIHHYFFSRPEDISVEKSKIEKIFTKQCKIENTTRCGSHAPGVYRYCMDICIAQ